MRKNFLTAYFSFTRKERTGIITLIIAIIIVALLPFLYPLFVSPSKQDATAFEKDIAALHIKQQDSTPHRYNNTDRYPQHYSNNEETENDKPTAEGILFYFDPNTASTEDWHRLGLRDKTIGTIQNYLSKGGHFYKPEDLGKIWGLHPDEVNRLIPYVQIATAAPSFSKTNTQSNYVNTKHSTAMVDINMADTAAFIALPGIGSKLAQRIINFRDKLGGFYSVSQVGETYGLPDSTFQKIKPLLQQGAASVRQININKASLDELKAHPYIRYTIANAIINYRNQHGPFASATDIKKIMLVTVEVFSKIEPYITVN